MALQIFQVDAFTEEPYSGNPAAVCILPRPRAARWMQRVAAEMNLSETAFLVPRDAGYNLRWFTPTVEVDLCGHATLVSAHVLWESGYLKPHEQVRFYTRSGLLTAERQGDWIEMDFPATPERVAQAPAGLGRALGLAPKYVGRSKFDFLVEVDSEATVRKLKPDFTRLGKIAARGVIVTSKATTPGFDFVSRFFAPASGVNEDPVTGSSHTTLVPYWRNVLGKDILTAMQLSKRRGELKCKYLNDRVEISGKAKTYLSGEIII